MAQLHEHQAKKILSGHGIAIPRGRLAKTAAEASVFAGELGGEVVVKAQVYTTSRAALGGVRFAKTAGESERFAAEMLGSDFAGNLCESVLIDEKLAVANEYYLGFIVDSGTKRPTLLFSESGGSGIESRSGGMKKLICSVRREPSIDETRSICGDDDIARILQKLYRAALRTDARTAEINPLARLTDGRLVALDGRISVDDYADFRQPDLGIEIARELGHTATKLEKIAWGVEKNDFRGTFFFVEILDDKTVEDSGRAVRIGFHGAGGGGSMASLDAAERNCLSPACFVDTSGNPPASKVYRAAKIILSLPNIKGYFLSGSGVASQEQFGLARGVLKAFLESRPRIPAVLRLGGNGEDTACELVERYGRHLPAPIEAYRKKDTADFCASRLLSLIETTASSADDRQNDDDRDFSPDYSFRTRTGRISFDYSRIDRETATVIVDSCPQKILKPDENGMPILGLDADEVARGKCSECLACEFASLDQGLRAVRIDLPIEGLELDAQALISRS